ncbi:MAG: hypothetical protein HY381_00660 [Candidatus Chisholmbacteria bacterium]|nr:hypothetical protein [Candidatus Chisholmbacteria bacterium]
MNEQKTSLTILSNLAKEGASHDHLLVKPTLKNLGLSNLKPKDVQALLDATQEVLNNKK